MRYGKVYFYDRMGNKVRDEEPVIKEEIRHFSINSPRVKVHANIPFDDHRHFPGATSLLSPDHRPMSGPLTTQELISFDRPALPPELDDLNFGPVDSPLAVQRGYALRGDTQMHQRSTFDPPLFAPLNDLKDPDDPKQELARHLDRIDLNQLKSVAYDDELCSECQAELCHAHDPSAHDAAVNRTKSLVEQQDSDRLRFKLREHVDEINYEQIQRDRFAMKEPMTVLPPFANRPDEKEEKMMAQRERNRLETEEMASRRRLAEIEANDLEVSIDARPEMDEKERERELAQMNAAKDAEFNRMQAAMRAKQKREEDNRVEWWENRDMFGQVKMDRDRKHIADQLRRNEHLRQNVERLADFEEKYRQQREATHLMRHRQHDAIRGKLDEGKSNELTIPEAARRQREALESVWDKWVEAHTRNDRRYRVLQEYDARKHKAIHPTTGGSGLTTGTCDVKRCRRCRRPLAKHVAFAAH
ncbi:hypothetical protein M3Y98_01129300 [Aphelenchoides besseyi]|nr:hypothetical protein M3Y98_01129300 [Aphelenchoides besseyi]KAI6210571.1 hypothetical protein M3Y96_00342300 [Aphelenchoides besseyi]